MSDLQPSPRAEQERLFRQRFGEHLRALRLERGLNQDEFAYQANLHRSHIGLLENGQRDPQLTTLYRLATALGITMAQLLDIPILWNPLVKMAQQLAPRTD